MDTDTKKLLKDFRYLNPGIFRYRRKRLIKLLAKIVAFDLIFILFAIKGYEIDPVKSVIFSVVCAIILPILIFSPYKYLKPSYAGKITDMKYVVRRIFPKGIFYPGARAVITPFIIYSITDEKGNKHRIALKQDYECVYQIGDIVLMILGLDYPICYTKRNHAVCVKCGALFVPNGDSCEALFCNAKLPIISENAYNDSLFL